MLREKAYAKINLFLNVINKREDGYHDLEMVMAPLKLHDELSFLRLKTRDIIVKSNVEVVTNIDDNIVYKVAKFLQEEFDVNFGVEININKNIPIGGGLAGGSADAAATFRGLNKLWKLNLTLDDMAALGVKFGADIPFCIYNKMALVKGIGEKLTFIKSKFKPYVLLVNPNIQVSTKEVFDNFKKEYIVNKNINLIIEGIKSNDYITINNEIYNSLEEVTFKLYPKVKEVKNSLKNSKLETTLMSGSGATVFSLSKKKAKLEETQKLVKPTDYNVITKLLK